MTTETPVTSMPPAASIPASRALIPHPAVGRLPARRRVEMPVRSWHLARVARAAGAVAVGLAAKSVLRALLARRERGLMLAGAGAALATQDASRPRALTRVRPSTPAVPSISVAQPFEVSRVIEALPGAARLMVTEVTVIERRRRR